MNRITNGMISMMQTIARLFRPGKDDDQISQERKAKQNAKNPLDGTGDACYNDQASDAACPCNTEKDTKVGEENINKQQSILQQIEGELRKSELEGHKGKLKELLKKKREAEKVVAGIDREIEKYLEDNGLS